MKLPKFLQVLDRIFPIRRRKKVIVDKEPCRGAFHADTGIELERGHPEEFGTLKHEAGHACFYVSNVSLDWEKRLCKELAEELEEDVVDRILPLYVETLRKNGLL